VLHRKPFTTPFTNLQPTVNNCYSRAASSRLCLGYNSQYRIAVAGKQVMVCSLFVMVMGISCQLVKVMLLFRCLIVESCSSGSQLIFSAMTRRNWRGDFDRGWQPAYSSLSFYARQRRSTSQILTRCLERFSLFGLRAT
jgi:hypothetical protein